VYRIILGVLAVLFAASSPAQTPAKVFRYAFKVAETGFDPMQTSDLYSSNLLANIFDPPLGYDFLARPVKLIPNTLSEMPAVTEGGTLYTLKVKPGIYFTDDPAFKGKRRELTAADYVYGIKRNFDPRLRAPNLYLLEGNIVGMDEVLARARRENRLDYDSVVEGLRTLDRYTFQVRLKQPNYNFLWYFAHCNTTCAIAREVAEMYGEKIGEHPVGTGPFRLSFWKRSSKIVMERNPGYREEYFDGEPAPDDERARAILALNKGKRLPMVDRVEVYIIEEAQPRWLAFLNEEHDIIERVPEEFAHQVVPNGRLAPNLAKKGMQLDRNPGVDVTYSYFAMKDPVVGGYSPDKIALRRAIVMGQDAQEEVFMRFKSQAVAAQTPVSPGVAGYDPEFRSAANQYDPVRSKALLDMYGYLDCDGDGYRDLPRQEPGSPCRPLSIEFSAAPDREMQTVVELWKKNMDAIGIHMTFKRAKWPDLLKESKAGKLQMWTVGWSAAVPDADSFFVMLYGPNGGQANHSRFQVAEFDRLYVQAKRLPHGPERDAIYREMNRIFLVYSPWRLGAHRILNDVAHPWVVGYTRHPVMRGFWKYVDIDTSKLPTGTVP
jgi:ABC-type transport system substrate-binding protein